MPLINSHLFPWLNQGQQQTQGGTPGTTPNPSNPLGSVPVPNVGSQYQNMIQNDPWYIQQKGLLDAQAASDKSNISQQMQQLLVDYGMVPEGFTSPYLSATTGPLAQQNTDAGLSILARLQRASNDARRGMLNERAARGSLRSGGTGTGLGRLAMANKQATYDSSRQVLDMINQMLQSGTGASFNRQQSLLDAMFAAYNRQLGLQQNRFQ